MCETTFRNEQNKQQINKTNEQKKMIKQHTIFIHQNFNCSENCPYLEFSWSALFRIWTYYGPEKLRIRTHFYEVFHKTDNKECD